MKTYENFINKITVFHGGPINGEIRTSFYVTDNDFAAESYGEPVYEFELNSNANILDLTNEITFSNIKKKIFDNYSELYTKYVNYGFYGSKESEKRKLKEYNTLKEYKNYDEIIIRLFDLLNDDFFKQIYDDYDIQKIKERNYIDVDEIISFYQKNRENINKDKLEIIDEFILFAHIMNNINRLDDFGLNEFGSYFYDYTKKHNYDAYKAWSSDASGQLKVIEYCIINVEIINFVD